MRTPMEQMRMLIQKTVRHKHRLEHVSAHWMISCYDGPWGGLNGNFQHRHRHLNSQTLGGNTVWMGLRGLALLKKLCQWWQALRASPFTQLALYFLFVFKMWALRLLLQPPCLLILIPLEWLSQINPSLIMVFNHSNRRVTNTGRNSCL